MLRTTPPSRSTKPTRKPRQVDLAWAAGLFEGEGSIGFDKRRSHTRLELGTTDRDVAERFQQLVGGCLCDKPQINRRFPDNKPFWRWSATRIDDVTRILGWLYPHLGARRKGRALDRLHADIRLK